jgi:hypothetical protein
MTPARTTRSDGDGRTTNNRQRTTDSKMNINRYNYEEYFILYLDNELSDEDRHQVEIFVQENTDLKAELGMLLQSKLIPDANINFDNKEMLMVKDSSISITNYEEWLLSYIDNELIEEERNDVERFVAANPIVQKEFNLLQQTKLQSEEIIFPYKKSLYRKEEKARIVSMRWWRVAAAAVLLLGISTTAIVLMNNKSGGGKIDIAKEQPKIEISTDNIDIKKPGDVTPPNQKAIDNNNSQEIESPIQEPGNTIAIKKNNKLSKEKDGHSLEVKLQETIIVKSSVEKKPDNKLPKPDFNPNVTVQSDQNIAKTKTTPDKVLTNSDQKTDSATVTPGNSDTYYTQKKASDDAKDSPDVKFASNTHGQKGGLRGFFRKVTRTFEKRTNIKATDDDDRLLIAGLTIKLN